MGGGDDTKSQQWTKSIRLSLSNIDHQGGFSSGVVVVVVRPAFQKGHPGIEMNSEVERLYQRQERDLEDAAAEGMAGWSSWMRLETDCVFSDSLDVTAGDRGSY